MGNKISLGEFNIYYIYIILYINFELLSDYLYGHNFFKKEYDIFSTIKIFPSETQNDFADHYFIHQIFNYLGTLIIAIITQKKSLFKKIVRASSKSLIYKNVEEEIKSRLSFGFYLFIIILLVLEEQLIYIYCKFFKDIDFWMIELLIIAYMNSHMFKINIYKHQKLAIYFNAIVPLILKIATIFLSLKVDEFKKELLYVKMPILILPFFPIYIFLISLRSYINTKIKWYMDIKYISEEKILISYGFFGALLGIIFSIITTIVAKKRESSYGSQYNFFEDIFEYFDIYKNGIYESFLEILLILLSFIISFCKYYFFLVVIKYFTPVHAIFSNPIYYIFDKLFLFINTLINTKGKFFDTRNKDIKILKVLLDLSGDILSILGYLIYLELIVLHFNKYDYNIKHNIMKRSKLESLPNIDIDESVNFDDEPQMEESN